MIGEGVLLAATALLPLLTIPATDNFLGDTKIMIAFGATLIVIALFGAHIIAEKALKITLSPFTAALIWLVVAALGATFLTNQYPHEALLDFGGVYLAMAVLAGFGSTLLSKHSLRLFPIVLAVSGALLSLCTILEFAGVGPSWAYNALFHIQLPHSVLFNLAESSLIAFQILVVATVGLVAYYLHSTKKNPFALVAIFLFLLAGLGVSLYVILPGKVAAPILPSLTATWSIALDVLRAPRTAIFGVGPSSFTQTYNIFKPAWVNTTPYWGVQFTQGFDTPLSILITLGLVGFGAWVFLVFHILKRFRKAEVRQFPTSWMLLAMLVLQLLFPPHTGMLALFGITLAFWLAAQAHLFEHVTLHTFITRLSPKSEVPSTKVTHILTWVTGLAFVLLAAAGFYGYGRAYAANNYIYRSIRAAQANDIAKMYQFQQKATQVFIDQRGLILVGS